MRDRLSSGNEDRERASSAGFGSRTSARLGASFVHRGDIYARLGTMLISASDVDTFVKLSSHHETDLYRPSSRP
ncbi:uncharacterized protein K489DRAFT_433194 [Dissoconium aciculare CBS 342.82]|uniref:Uncharacterized protein n=1 Tax=Dissoconium aciculare CBS 342.82 TaxID=1314786 RepID=A0A6J3M0M9_9PEZI|nr:uncharacterized protein K489DRAFT_433194 [Dissoconium aciculare CBS 342.82]KAF1820457.1 hypothetical protein K489DRAFT_433194 [Dissoconium aciculare CBS 342.82]